MLEKKKEEILSIKKTKDGNLILETSDINYKYEWFKKFKRAR